jgi:hypothetical protein
VVVSAAAEVETSTLQKVALLSIDGGEPFD